MQQSELLTLKEFSSNLQTIEKVLVSRLSESLGISAIAVNLSPLLNVPIFCLLEENNPEHISIRSLLQMFIDRWVQEIQYQQQILDLKDQLFNMYDGLCNQIKNEKLTNLAKKQCQKIVESLFAGAEFDKKQQAGNFCKGIMNGFENEMIQKINFYAVYVLWAPFINNFPKGIIKYAKKILQEENFETPTEASIVNASAKIINYVEGYLQENEIRIGKKPLIMGGPNKNFKNNNFESEAVVARKDELEKILKRAERDKKACCLFIENVGCVDEIIHKERAKIKTVHIKGQVIDFLQTAVPFAYEYLELSNLENENDCKKIINILQRLPKCLKMFSLEFQKNKINEMKGIKIVENEQECVYEFTFDFKQSFFMRANLNKNCKQNELSSNQIRLLADLLNSIKYPLSFIIPKLVCHSYLTGTSDQVITLSNIIAHSNSLNHLNMNYEQTSISVDAFGKLAIALNRMNQMKYLELNFSWGKNLANDDCMKLFSKAIQNMTSLDYLNLDFSGGNNQMTDIGMKSLGKALKHAIKITTLKLNFREGQNDVSDIGIGELSKSIANFSNLQYLDLHFGEGKNCITDKGIQQLSGSVINLKHIQSLLMRFYEGYNCIGDTGIEDLARSLVNLQDLKYLALVFCRGRNCITNKGIESLANILAGAAKLNKLYMWINYGNNKISNDGIKLLADALAKLTLPLDLKCYFIGHPNTVTRVGIDYLKKARTYSKFIGGQ